MFRNKLQKKIDKGKISEINREMLVKFLHNTNKRLKIYKKMLYKEFNLHSGIRSLREESLNKRNIISVFDSVLTRTINIEENTLSTDIIIVQTYFFDVIEDIILDNFMSGDEKYVCLTASAGQIRTKKTVFIKESILLKHKNTLMCGLTIEDINLLGGVNINKYLAYLALANSATDNWDGFNIMKSIVVEDMETDVEGIVDFIDDETYDIIRQKMKIPISHTDGCGMMLPNLSDKSMMVRLPWIKGLLVPFAFNKFIIEANNNGEGKIYGNVVDIYGKSHNILEEGIQVIFTRSQFKMYKYFQNNSDTNKSGWEMYQDNYIKYKCQAGKCNEEEEDFSDAKINYQMLQTLTDMDNKELETIAKTTKHNILNIGRDRKTMLKVLGVKKSNKNKNNIQQALEIYPELLNDTYSKEILKQVKKSMVKEGRSAKLDINGVYTFIIPDIYAFCEYLILGDTDPKGLLNDGDVYCNLYPNSPKLDCLRSPHLYREHAIRNNIIDDDKKKWFITNGVYTSCHDLISKILQFDVDGDKSLVVACPTLISIAERNMEGIVPLYYNMRKAPAEIITNNSIYNGLKTAYTGGNIGTVSNNITKIWNSGNVNLEVVKLLCMENNFTIDYAKTLYKPVRPKSKKNMITDYTKLKTPHFFIYAKDKEKDKVEEVNNSIVNRLEKIIPNTKISFVAANLGNFDYKMMLKNKRIKLDEEVIKKYKEMDLKKHFMMNSTYEDDEQSNVTYLYQEIVKSILEVNEDIYYVTDVLVKYLYEFKKSNFKTTLWECFGNVIVENLRKNVETSKIYCEVCGDIIEQISNRKKYCEGCLKTLQKQQDREYQRMRYNSRLLEKRCSPPVVRV
ncbi:MAG TPA: hypothetical protein VIM42_00655 [Clostridium sp.]